MRRREAGSRRRRAARREVLIVGAANDPHVEAVIGLCGEAGAACALVSEDSLLSLELPAEPEAGSPAQATSVWWRLKPGFFRNEELTGPVQFVQREWHHALEAFQEIYGHAHWVNQRAVDRFIRHKPNQLAVAQQCGLRIPPTLVSNDPERVLGFVEALRGSAIYKPLSWFSERPSRQLFTTVIDAAAVRAHADGIRRAPGIFQPLLPKSFELRVTVVGGEIFAARIDSQAQAETSIDWRRNHVVLTYATYDALPPRVVAALRRFHRRVGLVFGAYDFVVTPEGEVIFLEVNPVGQWLWIEEATGLPISAAVAASLLRTG